MTQELCGCFIAIRQSFFRTRCKKKLQSFINLCKIYRKTFQLSREFPHPCVMRQSIQNLLLSHVPLFTSFHPHKKKWISHSGIDYCGFKLRTWNISSLLRKFHDIAKANDDADDVTDSGSHKKAPHKNFIHHQAIKNIFMYEEAFFNLCAIL